MITCYITHINTIISAANAPTRHAARLAALRAVPESLGELNFYCCEFRFLDQPV